MDVCSLLGISPAQLYGLCSLGAVTAAFGLGWLLHGVRAHGTGWLLNRAPKTLKVISA